MPNLLTVDQPLTPAEAEAVLALARSFPGYRPSSYRPSPRRDVRPRQPAAQSRAPAGAANGGAAATSAPGPPGRTFGPRLAGRVDAGRNFVRTGGRLGRADEDPAVLAARTNYFRGAYALDGRAFSPTAETLLRHERLKELAGEVHGREVVVPFLVYANLLIPGQELGVHTDVPAFRGVDPRAVPPWLLVVMAHSGLFEERRVPITTVVLYFGQAKGGEFAYYPDGPDGRVRLFDPAHNSAIALDADLIFHGVDRVHGDERSLPRLRATMELKHEGRDWRLRAGRAAVGTYADAEVRFSVSWKAYCFSDQAQRTSFTKAANDLPTGAIVRTLEGELCRRGKLPGPDHGMANDELAYLLIDEFVPFPPPTGDRAEAAPPEPSPETTPGHAREA